MARLRRLLLQLLHAFRPDRAEAELAREVTAHLVLLEDEYQRRGMAADEARTAARRAIGGTEQVKIRHRDARSLRWLDELLVDAKYAVRRFRSRPGTNVLAVAMLSVAIGLSTAMFTIVDALIVRPLPFPHAERLTGLYMGNDHGGTGTTSPRVLLAWRQSPGFERVEGATSSTVVVESDSGPTARQAAVVTPGLFDMLGASPLDGRLFDPEAADERSVLISETLWRSAFEADDAIVGREIRIDGDSVVVVGVLPAAFRFPEWNTAVWKSRRIDGTTTEPRLGAVVRLAAGVPKADAFRMATELAHAVEASTVDLYAREDPVGTTQDTYYERAVPFLAGAVALVVLVLCANVSSLLLTQLRARRREFAVCMALGASRGRLLRQTMVESLLMGTCGAMVGVAFAWGLVSIASAVLPQAFLAASLNPLDLDLRAFFVAAATGVVATCAAGIIPTWLGTRTRAGTGHPLTERGSTETRRGRLSVRALLVAEVAFACALLVGATLLVRSFVNVAGTDTGFDPSGMVTLTYSFDESGITAPAGRAAATAAAGAAALALPGVTAGAWSSNRGIFFGNTVSDLPGATPVRLVIETRAVGPEYFDLFSIRLLEGRNFSPQESEEAVIIGERLAAALWPGIEPVGQTFKWHDEPVRVIGVVRETRESLVDADREHADLYIPFDGRGRYPTLNLRCASTCPSEGVFRQAAMIAGPARLWQTTYLDQVFARDLEQPRASAVLVGTFALVALIASAGGLFGVLSYAVQERRREFGIRSALGATPAAIAQVVYREGAIVGLIGLALGAALATAMASSLASLSYGVTVSDPISVAVVITTLVATITFALWRPARNAAQTDPALLLREE